MTKSIKYNGWTVWSLETNWMKLLVAPQLGGRLIQLEMAGYEFFFVNQLLAGKEPDSTRLGENGTWVNYGGEKIWPAPQGWNSSDEWPGPPDPILDSGEYALEFVNQNTFKLTSPFDPYTGLTINKEVTVSDNRTEIKVLASFKNTSDVTRTWSIWPVLQMNASGKADGQYHIVCQANSQSKFANGYKIMHGLANNPQYKIDDNGNVRIDYQYIVGKIGLDTNSNYAAFIDTSAGKVFILSFNYQENSIYPDNTSFQVWTSGQGTVFSRNVLRQHPADRKLNPPYMEMELLSPLQEIEPGKEIQFEYRMLTTTIPANESIKTVNEFGVIADSLKLEWENDDAFVTAKYGVFAEVVLKIQKRKILSGDPVCLHELPVNPLHGIKLKIFLDKKCLSDCEVITADLFDRDNRFVAEIDRKEINDLSYE